MPHKFQQELFKTIYCNLLDIKISLIVRKYDSQETINILSFKCGINGRKLCMDWPVRMR